MATFRTARRLRSVPTFIRVGCADTHGNDGLLQGDVDGDEDITRVVNGSIAPDSSVALEAMTIATYDNSVLDTVTGIDKAE